jgi:integrase
MIRAFSYLQRDKQSGVLYFCYAIPMRYQQVVGKKMIRFSLRTTDKRLAIPLAQKHHADILRKLDKVGRKMAKGSEPDWSIGKITAEEIDVRSGKAKNLEIDYGGDLEKELAALQAIKNTLTSGTLKPDPPVKSDSDSIKLGAMLKAYRSEKMREKSWTDRTHLEHEALHVLTVQIIGNVETATVNFAHGRTIKETLLALPPNAHKKYPGMTVRQILAAKPKERMNVKTVNDKIQRLSSVFSWGVRQGHLSINPFAGLKLKDSRSEREQRDRFSLEDIKKIFDPTTFNEEILKESWQYWVPLLGLYTGARLEEISQLRMEDNFSQDGIPVIRLTEEAGHLKTKTSNRIVPIHSKLIELGFLDFVTGRQIDGGDKLFPRLWTIKASPGDKAGRWFNRTFLGKFKLGPKKTFHSLRHTAQDELFKKLIDERTTIELFGYKQGSISASRYSKGLEIKTLKEAIEQLDYDL